MHSLKYVKVRLAQSPHRYSSMQRLGKLPVLGSLSLPSIVAVAIGAFSIAKVTTVITITTIAVNR